MNVLLVIDFRLVDSAIPATFLFSPRMGRQEKGGRGNMRLLLFI